MPDSVPGEPLVLSVPQAATLLNVSAMHVRRMALQQRIPSIRIGERLFIPRRQLMAWIDEQSIPAVLSPINNRTAAVDQTAAVR